ncbi:Homeobox-leucine zipper protein ROC5 [Linum perenne]
MYEVEDDRRGKKRKYQRHTQEQQDELEKFFLNHPHPTEKQRIELSMKIGMEMQKIKFWFQNRRTHMKIQLERHENILLRKQNDKLIAENVVLRQNVTEPTPIAFENEQHRAEVARLNEQVLWLEHVQYDESLVHLMMRPMVRSGMGFGARRWIATLQRYCECVALFRASSGMPQDPSMLSTTGKNSLMKLSQKMVNGFYRGISVGLSNSVWEKLSPTSVGEDVRILSRKNSTDQNEAVGIVLSGSTSLCLPFSRRRVFEFLMREDMRKAWDLLKNGGPLEEVVRIPKAQTPGNSVSILRVAKTGYSDDIGTSFILQETWNDATSSSLVYTTVDAPIMDLAMSGGDSSFAALFPSGFIIFPDGKSGGGRGDGASTSTDIGGGGEEGCIMTAEFQILASTNPESEQTINKGN